MPNKNLITNIVQTVFAMRTLMLHKGHCSKLSLFKKVVLNYILEKKNPTMKELAFYLQISMPSVTSIIDDLKKMQLIKRVIDKKDRRVIRVSLTNKGQAFTRRGLKEMKRDIEKIFSVLTAEEQKKFFELMQKIYNHIENAKI
jgi:DNA-binding MarR family transcriptional regulator